MLVSIFAWRHMLDLLKNPNKRLGAVKADGACRILDTDAGDNQFLGFF